MQVFEQQDDRGVVLRGDPAKYLSRRMEGAVADLLAVVANPPDVLAIAEVETDEMAKEMGVRLGLVLADFGCEEWRVVRSSWRRLCLGRSPRSC